MHNQIYQHNSWLQASMPVFSMQKKLRSSCRNLLLCLSENLAMVRKKAKYRLAFTLCGAWLGNRHHIQESYLKGYESPLHDITEWSHLIWASCLIFSASSYCCVLWVDVPALRGRYDHCFSGEDIKAGWHTQKSLGHIKSTYSQLFFLCTIH